MSKKTITKKEKARIIVNWVASILSIIIACFALILIVSNITSAKKGYTSIFGYAYFTVESESMNAENGFAKGDIIYVKLLNDDQKMQLKEGEIITFWDTINARRELNTHRILNVVDQNDGSVKFRTKGDANINYDMTLRTLDDVQGVYQGKSPGFGKAIMWIQTKTGFLVSVVVPSVLIVLYCLYLVIFYVVQYNKKKLVLVKEEMKDEMDEAMRAKLKQELLQELEQEKSLKEETSKE